MDVRALSHPPFLVAIPYGIQDAGPEDLEAGPALHHPRVAARTREGPWTTIARLLGRFSPDECRNRIHDAEHAFDQAGNAPAQMRVSQARAGA